MAGTGLDPTIGRYIPKKSWLNALKFIQGYGDYSYGDFYTNWVHIDDLTALFGNWVGAGVDGDIIVYDSGVPGWVASAVGGDLLGPMPNPKVVGINGYPIDQADVPNAGDILQYNGGTGELEWSPPGGALAIATQPETDAGTDDTKAITPLKLTAFAGFDRWSSAASSNEKVLWVNTNSYAYTQDGAFHTPFKTIQQAVTRAQSLTGNRIVIMIAPGNYSENVVFAPASSKSVHLQGLGSQEPTTSKPVVIAGGGGIGISIGTPTNCRYSFENIGIQTSSICFSSGTTTESSIEIRNCSFFSSTAGVALQLAGAAGAGSRFLVKDSYISTTSVLASGVFALNSLSASDVFVVENTRLVGTTKGLGVTGIAGSTFRILNSDLSVALHASGNLAMRNCRVHYQFVSTATAATGYLALHDNYFDMLAADAIKTGDCDYVIDGNMNFPFQNAWTGTRYITNGTDKRSQVWNTIVLDVPASVTILGDEVSTITHNMNNRYVAVEVIDAATYETVTFDVIRNSVNAIRLVSPAVIPVSTYKVIIRG